MEQYLRAYANYEQDNWVELLPLAQFAYNNAVHASTRVSPFYANYGYHPTLQFKSPAKSQGTEIRAEQHADAFVETLRQTHERLREHILEAQRWQTKYAKGKAIEFAIGERVWLSTRHIKTQRESKKLDYKRIGPYRVIERINANAYRLQLPPEMQIHNAFHVSLLDRYIAPVEGQTPAEPLPTIVEGTEEYDVDRIIDSRYRYRRLQYLVQWAGYDYVRTSWEPVENVEHSQALVDEFHQENPRKPKPRAAGRR